MSQFHTRSFNSRFRTMGDPAEKCFAEWAEQRQVGVERWGLDRPNFDDFQYLPDTVKWRPDHICEDKNRVLKNDYGLSVSRKHVLCEVKGCGKDGIIKIKIKHLPILKDIEMFERLPIVFFIYNSASEQHALATRHYIEAISVDVPVQTFHEGNEYHAIPIDYFDWTMNWWRK